MNTNRTIVSLSVIILLCLLPAIAMADSGAVGTTGNAEAASDSINIKSAVDTPKETSGEKHQIVVYYFYTTQRCSSCLKIEAYAKETLDSSFAAQMKDSLVVWRLTNIDEKDNEHFQNDYQLYTKSVIISDVVDGKQLRWKNMEKIWEYLDDKAAFQTYIRAGIDSYLKAD